MKKIFSIVIITLGFLYSCTNTEGVIYNGPDFLQIKEKKANLTEDQSEGIITTVMLSSSENKDGITVKFSVISDNPERYTILPINGEVIIPAGEFSAEILITPIDNDIVDGDLELTLELSKDNTVATGLGGEGLNFANRTFTLLDNDCPIILEEFVGAWQGKDSWGYETQITTALYGEGKLTMRGIGFEWMKESWDEIIIEDFPVVLDINLETGQIVIEEQLLMSTTYKGALQPPYYVKGTGKVISPCSKIIEIEYILVQPGFDWEFDGTKWGPKFKETIQLK
ncbi:MAG: hypothetical protein JKY08_04355 [Flavobacteriaceae bacterium]|nr:hypothetical protein [Flavobacteriaceae bacterium]